MVKRPKATKGIAASVQVPQSRDACAGAIGEIGRLQREKARIEGLMNDEIAVIRERFEAQAQPISTRIDNLRQGVQIWCDANRAALTRGGKVKSAQFPTGEVRWRVTPPKVVIRGLDAVIDALRRAGLTRFLRTKEEINKEAILADTEAVIEINGIRIDQVEEFVVEPFETELADRPEAVS